MSKAGLHTRNRFRERYDFPRLVKACPPLAKFIAPNAHGDDGLDYSNPDAVKALNRALLADAYAVQHWDIPRGYLCPPIPGRSDYIHHLADLIGTDAARRILDIGTGANCIYPIIGAREYGWRFVGADIDAIAAKWARALVAANPQLRGKIDIRLQPSPAQCFAGIIRPGERFDATMCNPPFHATAAEAAATARQKQTNLGIKKDTLNFGGTNGELWCVGGELAFIRRMISQSVEVQDSCDWFTTLVSKSANIPPLQRALKTAPAREVRTIEMAHGQKKSRILAWTFRG
jgi:23S rRNA (adenine1618-N6)-methyltransferase